MQQPQSSSTGLLVFRQILQHKSFLTKDGRPQPLAFEPRLKDHNQLSVDDGAIWSAEQSYNYHLSRHKELKLRAVTAGSWSLPKIGIEQQKLRISPAASKENPSHALIDMTQWAEASAPMKLLIISWFVENAKLEYPTTKPPN